MKERYLEVAFRKGKPFGIEITDPNKINWHVINEILMKLNLHPAEEKALAPLLAA